MTEFRYFRSLLERERAGTLVFVEALRRSLTAASEARWGSNVDDEHDPEGATIAFELSQASSHIEQSEKRLEEIDAALSRIDGGRYGRCLECGADIAEGRLEARPWTPFCIEHAAGARG